MLKVLHTADWHVGRTFGLFDGEDADKLARDRITVVERIFGLADRYDVDAVLCAGDLFDVPTPDPKWWQAVGDRLASAASPHRPIVLLPGSHDPLMPDSVYAPGHEFRQQLPDSVHVVDHDKFELPVGDGVIYAAPCTSHAGDRDLAMGLPKRELSDNRIRIGMVHGSAFEQPGSTNYPISPQAPAKRGLDYLAIGDTHSWKEVDTDGQAPMVYPGTPEPTSFTEKEAGYVALATFRRSGVAPKLRQERVNRWSWRDQTITSMAELHSLAGEDLKSTVLRLRLQMTVDMIQLDQVEQILSTLKGSEASNPRTGALICDRTQLRVNVSEWSIDNLELPETIQATIDRLKIEAASFDRDQDNKAQRALLILRRMLTESLQPGMKL